MSSWVIHHEINFIYMQQIDIERKLLNWPKCGRLDL